MISKSFWTALVFTVGCFFSLHAQEAERSTYKVVVLFDDDLSLDTTSAMWRMSNWVTGETKNFNPKNGAPMFLKSQDVVLVCYGNDCNRWVFSEEDISHSASWGSLEKTVYYFFQPNYHLENPLVVSAFSANVRNERAPSMIGILNFKQWNADGSSLQQGLNAIPGVMLESRGQGGSPRINIRGSMLRSTFGIRNVRMYFNGFTLTSPDGTTPMETIDPMWVSEAEVIKGPAAAEYGNGTGGVVLMKGLRPNYMTHTIKSSLIMGSWGYNRLQYAVNVALPIGINRRQFSLAYVKAGTHGYRDQEYNNREQVLLTAHKEVKNLFNWGNRGNDHVIGSNITQFQYHNGHWALPGSLNAKELASNRKAARPFSLANDTRLERKRWMMGFGQDRNWNSKWEAIWRLSYQSSIKINPYGTSAAFAGFKDESNKGWNGRAQLGYQILENKDWSLSLKSGLEWQQEHFTIEEFNLTNGERGDLKYNYDVNFFQAFAHFGGLLKFRNWALLQAGIAQHQTNAQVSGAYGSEEETTQSISWDPQWTPRVAASIMCFKDQYLFANYGEGFSNPNVFEQVDYTAGQFNVSLQPELGNQWECGYKGALQGVEWQLARYQQTLSNIILPNAVSSSVPESFINSGSTSQNGWEVVLQYNFFVGESKFLRCNGWINGHKADYVFTEYTNDGENFSGQLMPGTALHTAQAGCDFEWNEKWQFTISDQWVDRMALNNANTVWSNPYHLMQVRLSGNMFSRESQNRSLSWHWMIGVNNALNSMYSSFHQLNDAGGRYYNPSPERNFYVGLSAFVHRPR